MNKVIASLIVALALGAITETKAQTTFMASSQLPQSALQVTQPETGKYQIATKELPKPVKKALKKSVLNEWEISKAYIVEVAAVEENPKLIYEIYLVNDSQKRTVARFYKNGEVVSGKN